MNPPILLPRRWEPLDTMRGCEVWRLDFRARGQAFWSRALVLVFTPGYGEGAGATLPAGPVALLVQPGAADRDWGMSVTNAAEDIAAAVLTDRLPEADPAAVALFEHYAGGTVGTERTDACDRVLYDGAEHEVGWRSGTLTGLAALLGDEPPDLGELCARIADPDPR